MRLISTWLECVSFDFPAVSCCAERRSRLAEAFGTSILSEPFDCTSRWSNRNYKMPSATCNYRRGTARSERIIPSAMFDALL